MKASFFRNVSNYKTLCDNLIHYDGVIAEYRSIAIIYLPKNEFTSFCKDFQNSYDYLLPFVDEAIITHGIWKCVSIVCGEVTLLAVMDHYQYPRYLAIASK